MVTAKIGKEKQINLCPILPFSNILEHLCDILAFIIGTNNKLENR